MDGVRGFVLAGGRSSRMGVNKAELRLGGRTLLEIAIGKLAGRCEEVVVVGQGSGAPEGVRVIADRHPGCGPMGGIEAALRDLREETATSCGWAAFVPVDMPLVPGGLVRELLREWTERGRGGMRVAMVEADGRAQPLLSLLRGDLLRAVEGSLEREEYRVRPMLEQATAGAEGGMWTTQLKVERMGGGRGAWVPAAAEWRARSAWFGNLNTPEEFREAESFAESLTGAPDA